MLVSCSKDDVKPGPELPPQSGEERAVTLTIYDRTVGSRAAGTNTDPAVGNESTIDVSGGVKVVVFNEDGSLDFPKSGSSVLPITSLGTDMYQTNEFTVTTGQKYFYVFANDATRDLVPDPIPGMTRSMFINEILAITLDASDNLNITTSNFMMGTLWSGKIEATSGGIAGNPAHIQLTIGRLASKVTLNGVSKGVSNLSGTFSEPYYRLGTIPQKIFVVGHNDETVLAIPPASNHGVVTSAVHTAARYTAMPDQNYLDYTNTWKQVVAAPGSESFYTVENTTLPDATGTQYYGNTSFIHIRTVYTPGDDEVYNLDLSPKGSFTGPTFYTANLISSGARLIFEEDPRTAAGLNPDADIDQNTIQVYENGINYHEFPIHDPEEGLPIVQRNAVLRNHSYIYTVTSIADVGSPDPIVPPEKPVPTTTVLDIEVTVAPWSKVENTDVPI